VTLPVLALIISLVIAPWVAPVRDLDLEDPPGSAVVPALLYRHERVAFWFTTSDLRTPQTFGEPGRFVEAVVFDVLAAGESANKTNDDVTWVQLFWGALAGGPRPESTRDLNIANEFRELVGRTPRLTRGEAGIFFLPEESSYRQETGLKALAALAVRVPPEIPPALADAPSMFEKALDRALAGLRRGGVRSCGIPRMMVPARLGSDSTRYSSWEAILASADRAATENGTASVLFGAWALRPEARAENSRAFALAWQTHREQLVAKSRAVTHEHLRLGALILLSALIVWHRHGKRVTWKRLLALALAVGSLAASIAGLRETMAASLATLPIGAVFLVECFVALVAGTIIEFIVTFNFRKEIGEPDVPANPTIPGRKA
jgi:hypothetical protein